MSIESSEAANSASGDASKSRGGVSKWWWGVCFCLVMIFVGRGLVSEIDHQIANFVGIGWGLLAWIFALIATWRTRGWFLPYKVLITILPILVWGVFSLFYEYTGVSGEVLPQFRLRPVWRGEKVVRPQRPELNESRAVEDAYKGFEFTQYLGNERTGRVQEPLFSTAWDQRLPEEVWRREIGAGWSGFGVAQGIAVTLEQVDQEESLTALRLSDGATLWQVKRPGRHFHPLGGLGPRSTPTLVQRDGEWLIVALTATGHLICAELTQGKVRWELFLPEITGVSKEAFEQVVFWGRSASPLVVEGTVIVPVGGTRDASTRCSLMAIDLADGSVKWKGGKEQVSYASPVLMQLEGVEQIVSVNEGVVTGHALDDGRELWSSQWPSKSDADACSSQPVQVGSDRILFGKGYAQGSKLVKVSRAEILAEKDKGGEGVVWKAEDVWVNARVLKTKLTSAIHEDGKFYALSDGILECVTADSGERVWKGGRFGQGQLLLVNGSLVVLSEDGRIVVVDKQSGKLIAQKEVLEGITWNTFAVAGPYLLVRNGTQAVCLRSAAGESLQGGK
jgi:outer membrane protein assembly factor BamB